jgi:hypothetical protein
MKNNQDLQFSLRLQATAFLNKKVSRARISSIEQHGAYKKGMWGLANKKLPKIYILRKREGILYVGITKSPLSSRFRYGLTASGKNGYHGYAWKALAKEVQSEVIDLFVYVFNNEERTEAIEAEVVYLIRNRTGKWPKYQTEIHFHQAAAQEKRIAERIFHQISKS